MTQRAAGPGRKPLRPGQPGRGESKSRLQNGTWQVRRRFGTPNGTRRATAYGHTLDEARINLTREIDRRIGLTSPMLAARRYDENTDLATLINRHLANLRRSETLAQASIRHYDTITRNHLLPHFGPLTIAEADPGRLDDIMGAWEDETGSNSETMRHLLHNALELAIAYGPLTSNPADYLSARPTKRTTPVKAATRQDYRRLREAALAWGTEYGGKGLRRDSQLFVDAIDMMVGTGERMAEVLALRPCDVIIETEQTYILVRGTLSGSTRQDWTKGGEGYARPPRMLAVPARLAPMLQRRLDEQPDPEGPLFKNSRGRWYPTTTFNSHFSAIRTMAGLADDFVPHWLRKLSLTEIAQTLGLDAAQRQAGHTSRTTTEKYYIARPMLDPSAVAAANVLDDLFGDLLGGLSG